MTPAEIRSAIAASTALQALVAAGNIQAVAEALSVGLKRLVPTEIGSGTIVAQLRGEAVTGGQFLDALVEIGNVDRDIYWTMDLIRQGRLRIDWESTRQGLHDLATAVPTLANAVTKLLELGMEPDHITHEQVNEALREEG